MLSNELSASAFYTSPDIQVIPFSTPDITLSVLTSPDITLNLQQASDTELYATSYSLTLVPLLKNTKIAGITLESLLLAKLQSTQERVVAETWLEGIYEYGTGEEDADALVDLIVSMREYLDALEAREEQLGDSARQELKALRALIKR